MERMITYAVLRGVKQKQRFEISGWKESRGAIYELHLGRERKVIFLL